MERSKGCCRAARSALTRRETKKAAKTAADSRKSSPSAIDEDVVKMDTVKARLIDALGLFTVTPKTGLKFAIEELSELLKKRMLPSTTIYDFMVSEHSKFIDYMQNGERIWSKYRPIVIAIINEFKPYQARAKSLLAEARRRHLFHRLRSPIAAKHRDSAYVLSSTIDDLVWGMEEIRFLMDGLGWVGYHEECMRNRLTCQNPR